MANIDNLCDVHRAPCHRDIGDCQIARVSKVNIRSGICRTKSEAWFRILAVISYFDKCLAKYYCFPNL